MPKRPNKRRERRSVLSAGYAVLPRERDIIDPSLAWYALWARANRERRAAGVLEDAGIAVYRPLESRRFVRRNRAVVEDRAPVGRYLFAGLEHGQQFWDVREAMQLPLERPLAGLIRTENGPLSVPADVLQAFADAVNLHGEAAQARSGFLAGQVARVASGPFLGFLTRLESVDDDRVRGLVDLFGRATLVEFEPEWLEAA